MDVKRKHYFKIDANTSSDTIFAILESIESDQEEGIENLMNDSDTDRVHITGGKCTDVQRIKRIVRIAEFSIGI